MSKQDLLKTQTCILRVNIDCDGCKRKVRKILQKIDGVYATAIDMQQGKVTVTGDVEPDLLIKKLEKSGKHAELWSSGKGESKNKNSELESVNDQLKKLLQMGQGKNEVIKEKGGKDQQKGGVIGGGDGKNLQQVNFQQLLEEMRSGSKDFTIKDHKPVKVDLPSKGGGGDDDDDFEDFSGDESYDDDDDEYDDDDDDEFDEDEDYDDDEFDEDDDDEGNQQKTSMTIMGNGHGKDNKGGDNGGDEKAKKGGGNNEGKNGNEGKKGGGPKSGGEGKNGNKSGGGGGGGGKNGGFQDINVPHHTKGGGGGGMGPMGQYQVGPMGQQVMNMNGGGGGYYQGGMGPLPSNPYQQQQQQQYMAMMNQQRMMNVGGGGYHPAMYGRPPPGYGYMPPPAYSDHITHMFSDENPGSCNIM